MTRLVTMGTASCATVAIAGFKNGASSMSNFKNKDANDAYLADKSDVKTDTSRSELTVDEFMGKIISPTRQELGETMDMPFDKLMDEVDRSGFKGKFIIATLNESQVFADGKYWPGRLEARGFELIDKTNNDMGQTCWIYTRNNNRVK